MPRTPLLTLLLSLAGVSSLANAASIDTADAAAVAAFQHGLHVETFESVPGVAPHLLAAYNTGTPTDPSAAVFDQLPGVQFSVGGEVGVNRPVLFDLSRVGGAHSGTNVLGPVDFDAKTEFGRNGQIEMYFAQPVASVGFWLNPVLGGVEIVALNTNFAFSHEPETVLETAFVTQGHFVGISRPGADIGGFKIISLSSTVPFTIDDLSYGTAAPVPEPATFATWSLGLVVLAGAGWRRGRKTSA